MVIFVHELGHFAVAKLCGVKCEKFYLGFDIFGGKICKFRWGETEYGIGVLPLGGYVKMLGQEDNPARLKEELERAQAREAGGQPDADSDQADDAATANNAPAEEFDVEAAKQALYDPRSYLAQSVPKRMAIISAGVIMNVLFAVVVAVAAFLVGVDRIEPAVGAIIPGDAAWQLNLQVGDRIERIGDNPIMHFTDLKTSISLGDNIEDGLTLLVRRPGLTEPFEVTVVPERMGLAPTIGVGLPRSTLLSTEVAALPGSSAEQASPALIGGDRVVAIDGEPVVSYAQIYRHLAIKPDRTLEITVERASTTAGDNAEAPGTNAETFTAEVAPEPMRRVGLVMAMGPITSIQADSPASKAGLKVGDRIVALDDTPAGDPLTLPDRLRRLALESPEATLKITRQGESEPLDVEVQLREAESYDSLVFKGSPVSAAALGVAYTVLNRVEEVLDGSPAAGQNIKPGAVLVAAKMIPPKLDSAAKESWKSFPQVELSVSFESEEDKGNWAYLFYSLQREAIPGTQIELEFADGTTVTLAPEDATDWFNSDRGFIFELKYYNQKADSFGEAVQLGYKETVNSLTMVFRTIQKLSTQQVSARALGGPVMIAKVAYYSASEGSSRLFLFLCVISANLAVLNFLPIPVLDGGHMVFLAYEGVFRKPPPESVHIALSYLGFFLILTLMIWVLALDFNLIPRQ